MAWDNSIKTISTQTYEIVAGATNAQYVGIESNEVHVTVTYQTGGSLLMIGPGSGGTTLTAAQLAGYHSSLSYVQIRNNDLNHLDGPCGFYLAAIGGTSVASITKEYSNEPGVTLTFQNNG